MIRVEQVTKLYGTQRALDTVSFEIHSGEIVGFLGPNGAGKSTMMKILTGYIPQSAGNIWINNIAAEENTVEIRKLIGYLPEHNPLYLDMYVIEFLEFIADIYKIPEKQKRISQIIELTGLAVEKRKLIKALSKGYRQRVGLAQALIHDPKILILDEPTTGLDPNQIIEIRNLISEVGREKTVMLSTHIMQEVEAICDRVIIINQGRIVANDTTRKLKTDNAGQQIVLVEFNTTPNIQLLEKINGIQKVIFYKENQWFVQAVGDEDIRQHIFKFAVDNNLMVLSLQKMEKSLEDVFRNLTNRN